MRNQAKKMQSALAEIIEVSEAAHGGIRITMDGNQVVQRVEVADTMLTEKIRLEGALKEAFNEAVQKIQKKMAAKVKEMGGLDAFKNLGV